MGKPSTFLIFLLLISSILNVCLCGESSRTLNEFIFRTGELKQPNSFVVPWRRGTISHEIPLKIVFVGYDPHYILVDELLSILKRESAFRTGGGTAHYYLNITIEFLDNQFFKHLLDFARTIAINSTTSKLNETALVKQKQKIDNGVLATRTSIFTYQKGIAINAKKIEKFLENYSNEIEQSYYLYVLNFSILDSTNHGIEHWFYIREIDPDSNRIRDFWRLEWDNPLNPNVSFPYAAFSHSSRVFFIDPSAFNWYLAWARIWWGIDVLGPYDARYLYDLDEFLRLNDLTKWEGKYNLTMYLAGWINDALTDLFLRGMRYSLIEWYRNTFYTQEISVQVIIFNEAEDIVSLDQLDWVVNDFFIRLALFSLAPWISLNSRIELKSFWDDADIVEVFRVNNLTELNSPNWNYYNGYGIYSDLWALRSKYFNLSAADTVLTAWLFVLSNASMVIPWWNGTAFVWREFTGLGGGGQVIILMSVDRLFTDNFTVPKQGFTRVLIHEIGHALGFDHTFGHDKNHSSDFIFDVMGYYPGAWNFSLIRREMFWRVIGDERILLLINKTYLLGEYLNKTSYESSEVIEEWNTLIQLINESIDLLDKTKYQEALAKISQAEYQYDKILNMTRDTEGPTISEVSWQPQKPTSKQEVNVTAKIVDPSGVKQAILSYFDGELWWNISMRKIASSDYYTAEIPKMRPGAVVTFKIYAEDNMGNWSVSAEYTYRVAEEMLPIQIAIVVIVTAMVVVLIIYWTRKR